MTSPWHPTNLLAVLSPAQLADALFYTFAAMTVIAALIVAISRNIVRTAVGLLFALLGVSGLYFLLNAEFVAAVQLVVYVGGMLILIIFGVMLTGRSPLHRFEPKLGEIILALTAAAMLFVALWTAIEQGVPAASSSTPSHYSVDEIGRSLLGDYLVPFELASVVLLVVMIGAAYLARPRKREEAFSPSPDTPGEGRGGGRFSATESHQNSPHPNPPPAYREREFRPWS